MVLLVTVVNPCNIAYHFNWHNLPFGVGYCLAVLFLYERELDEAHAHIAQAKSHKIDALFNLARAMELLALADL